MPEQDTFVWLDLSTKEWLQWSWMWNQLNPLSIFGQEYKNNVTPFSKGEEKQWLVELEQTKKVEELLRNKRIKEELEEALSKVNDPRLFLQLLKKGNSGTEADWFQLKIFIWECKMLFQLLSDLDPTLEDAYKLAVELLERLQSEQKSFSLEEVTDLAVPANQLKTLRHQKLKLKQQLYQLQEQQRIKLENELQLRFQGQNLLFISKKESTFLRTCSVHTGLHKERETPFEMIFSLKPTVQECQLLKQIESVELELAEEERRSLEAIAKEFIPFITDLEQWARWIGLWDWRRTKVNKFSQKYDSWPQFDSECVHMHEGRYSPLEEQLLRKGRTYTPLSMSISYGLTTIVGSNMGGKSIALKTIAWLVTLAHYALPVPAASFRSPLFTGLVAVNGDQQSIEEGVSTFGAEMSRLATYINRKDQLLLMDELARGTNPREGEALALALGQYVAEEKDQVGILITHFSILTSIPQAQHYRVLGLEQNGQMNYLIVKNTQFDVPQNALMMAERIGLPDKIIESARKQMIEGNGHG